MMMTKSRQRIYPWANVEAFAGADAAPFAGGRRAVGASVSRVGQTGRGLAPWCVRQPEGQKGLDRLQGQSLHNQF
jgi:hypothetical protein